MHSNCIWTDFRTTTCKCIIRSKNTLSVTGSDGVVAPSSTIFRLHPTLPASPIASVIDVFMAAWALLLLHILIDANSCVYAPLNITGSDFQLPYTRWANQWGASHYGCVVVHLSAMHCARKHDLSKWPGDSAQQGRWGGVVP